ncbi:MAG: aminopeptidase [candidate division KSB1 bacterium]|nr:aminopeptidase [candidate division KSB1 bacterium]
MTELEKTARAILIKCVKVQKGESVLIITDKPFQDLARALYEMAHKLRTEVMLVEIWPRKTFSQEPPVAIAEAMKTADAVILATHIPLSNTKARREACQKGARILAISGTQQGAISVNRLRIAERSKKLADIFTIGRTLNLTTPAGTELIMSIAKVKGQADTGLVHHKGEFAYWPGGEAYLSPVAGQTQGTLIIDGTLSLTGKIQHLITCEVKDGYVIKISGREEAEKLRTFLKPFGKAARTIAELGLGTNDALKLKGLIWEDCKVMGTARLSLGEGSGRIANCVTGILLKPTVTIDGKVIVKGGKLVI